MSSIVHVHQLYKRYGATVAMDGISFDVQRGEIFAIVGPNGAGKTTTVESIVGLRRPDSGELVVLGLDPGRDVKQLRRRVGVQLQQAALPDRLKVWEVLALFSSFYDKTVPYEPLIVQWGLQEKRNTYFGKLSGGQQQRLFIALALLNDPELVVFDELTTGLDPQARRATWELVRAVRAEGKTVILVTHGMDEAEALADRVAIVDRGRVLALDTPQALISAQQPGVRVLFHLPPGFDPAILSSVAGVQAVKQDGDQVVIDGEGPLLARVASLLAERGLQPHDLRQQRATLEDVFLALTGRGLRD